LLENIVVSALVSIVVSRLTARFYMKSIDAYTDSVLETVKAFLCDVAEIISKRT